ncbi:MAG: V-type ATP synthase subunit D, partial [Desulfovibrio sp.]|nr:V-type ATP synthase subunit D [Desulfovibrio sp.]
MGAIKFTKHELKAQRDALARFTRFLPTLILKKQQLQAEIRRLSLLLVEKRKALAAVEEGAARWLALFAEPFDMAPYMRVDSLRVRQANVAGVAVEVLDEVTFTQALPPLAASPLWVDQGIRTARELAVLQLELHFLHLQRQAVAEELRITSQRVNLFEKVKIPEAKEHIRRIKIALGDLETAAVARAKMAKGR